MMEFTREERYLLWLNMMAGPEKTDKLLSAFDGSAEAVFCEAASDKAGKIAGKYAREMLRKNRSESYIDRCIERLDALGVKAVTIYSENYPELLKEIYDPPRVLYYKGELYRHIELPIGMIGTRHPSDYGIRVAEEFAETIANKGACIVSGMAYGLDGICARAALKAADNPYPTIAVLGSGIDVIYPKSNRDLYEAAALRGAVISEYMPGVEVRREYFPRRNRIISGLSRGLVIIEAGEKSGTLITAEFALEQGRDVFAVPGRITDPKSAGTNALIRSAGAKAVLTPYDVLEEYGVKNTTTVTDDDPKSRAATDEGKLICGILATGEKSFDELCELTGISAGELNSTLTVLEFSGIIKQSPGRVFSL